MSKYPPLHNSRAPRQWEVINKRVNFQGLRVIDLGCGYGDLVARMLVAGAKMVIGVDSSKDILRQNWDRFSKVELWPVWKYADLNDFKDEGSYDLSLCFSVLPYLEDHRKLLKWMRDHSTRSLIEAQYWGDGPGTTWEAGIQTDHQMAEHLGQLWGKVVPIGETLVDYRHVYRTIWLCG